MKNELCLFSLGSLLLLGSCIQEQGDLQLDVNDQSLRNLNIPDSFDYALSSMTEFDLSVSLLGGNPYSYAKFDIVTERPNLEGVSIYDLDLKTIASITLDAEGKYQEKLYIPVVYQNLYLVSKTGGIDPVIKLNRLANRFFLDYTPSLKNSRTSFENARTMSGSGLLGSWSTSGYPNYLTNSPIYVSAGLFARTQNVLREGQEVNGSQYRPDDNAYDIIIKTNDPSGNGVDVFVSFLYSFAAQRNSIGYYYWADGSPRSSSVRNNAVDRTRIIFPNTNAATSGLKAGETVRLVGPNPDGTFPDNYNIAFFLIKDAFNTTNGTIDYGNVINNQQNYGESERRFNDNLMDTRWMWMYDETDDVVVLGTEDLWPGAQRDYDDVVIFVSTPNENGLDLTGIPTTPTNVSVSGTDMVKHPSNNTFATVLFEDSWPALGDEDFNDVVIDYRYSALASETPVNDGNKYLSKIYIEAHINGADAAKNNGLGIMIPDVDPATVKSVTATRIDGSPSFNTVAGQTYSLEPGHTNDLVIILTENINSLFSGDCYNSDSEGCASGLNIEFNFTIEFDRMAMARKLSNFDGISPFLIIDGERGKEVHVAGRRPSVKANTSLFGTGEDNTIPGNNYFKSKETNIPWALDIPDRIPFPKNQTSIREAYTDFAVWAQSNGSVKTDWYTNTGARNLDKLHPRVN
ncbi:LruC domain-containing protein [uncultured Algoriphagus sp.]|uniref:LruC domain-containing protein n=1 Tax=uncultured Algoriphagus sp. TaxID=417365 RepID=UPI00259687E5|nr:LruC domain-containing protein [uncultured Algoriphagus sp.]